MIWDTSIWRLGCSNRSKIRSAQKCYPCLRYVVSHMCPGRTEIKWSGRKDLNLRPPGPEPGALARLRYAPTTSSITSIFAAGTLDYHSILLSHSYCLIYHVRSSRRRSEILAFLKY